LLQNKDSGKRMLRMRSENGQQMLLNDWCTVRFAGSCAGFLACFYLGRHLPHPIVLAAICLLGFFFTECLITVVEYQGGETGEK